MLDLSSMAVQSNINQDALKQKGEKKYAIIQRTNNFIKVKHPEINIKISPEKVHSESTQVKTWSLSQDMSFQPKVAPFKHPLITVK
mmetsp:Transcript_28410/g.32506  ORF Transcript_28410/g.32506 Transcript_28410/m.32506 type:complete len:86 (+) Transcript_28410:3-260(+)